MRRWEVAIGIVFQIHCAFFDLCYSTCLDLGKLFKIIKFHGAEFVKTNVALLNLKLMIFFLVLFLLPLVVVIFSGGCCRWL